VLAIAMHTITFMILISLFAFTPHSGNASGNLQLHYNFSGVKPGTFSVPDMSGNEHHGTLMNGALIKNAGKQRLLELGQNNAYLDMGSSTGELIASLNEFTLSVLLYIDPSTNLDAAGNFIATFANAENIADFPKGNMFLGARTTRLAISKTNWQNEEGVGLQRTLPKGRWQLVSFTLKGTQGTLSIDGVPVQKGRINTRPSDLGATTHNYLGKSCYASDRYLQNTLIADFRIYNKALEANELSGLVKLANELNAPLFAEQLSEAAAHLQIGSEMVRTHLKLPVDAANGIKVSWTSSKPEVLASNGKVNRPATGEKTEKIKLTALLTKGDEQLEKQFKIKVLPLPEDRDAVETDAAEIKLNANTDQLRSKLDLPVMGIEGSLISWKSDRPDFLSDEGKILQFSSEGKIPVRLTATVQKGNASRTRHFDLQIAQDEGFSSYLFAYFTGNGPNEEAIHFALSNDGFNYRALNDGKPIIDSKAISTTGGVRDPHILRGPDGYFYMVVTDLHVPTCGWSNTAMVLLKSKNLVNWTHSKIDLPQTYSEFSTVHRVWAPQTFYDESSGKYMVYFSMKEPKGIDIIYYAYTNSDFTAFESAPKQLLYSPTNNACIDGDIVFKNGKYHLFFKTEGSGNGIKKAVSDQLTEGYQLIDHYVDQTDSPVEGSGVFRMINSDTYILMYDMYTSGRYQFTESTDLENFRVIDNEISMNFHPRHGTVIPITRAEAQRLVQKWGSVSELGYHSSASEAVKKNNVVVSEKDATVYLPVEAGTDLTSFNPKLLSFPGAKIKPAGPVDFSNGPVAYTFSADGVGSKTWSVEAVSDHNPVLSGYYADPEIIYSEKDKKFYLYPTSDGYDGWSGTYFKTFSSPDLVHWTDEGVIVDLLTDVDWANRNAWAPTAIERKMDGAYRYFYYFTAAQKIGVAVNDQPYGRFTDSGKALVGAKPAGVRGGQEIDPDVFHDPVSDRYYLYWGNGYLACVLLNDDMVSFDEESLKIITPPSTFREGAEVFYRNGLYYFMWSENDTRDADYRVRYGYSSRPDTIEVIPENNLVIARDDQNEIYATGHNSVIQIPGKDEWYIVYHRFTRPKGMSMGRSAGFHREVCIDRMEFDSKGMIRRVKPTLKGIDPVK
jgi:hypothetical protein